MADNVRRIVAEFSAKNKAKGIMGGFRRDLDTTGRALRRLAVGALAVAGVGGFGYMIKKQMESIDQMAKMSDELQISTEALAGLEHAAKISGTNIENLHKALEIFVRRMGEAKYGVGEGVRGLKMLNLTAEEMISLRTEEAFMKIADRISKAGTAAEQAGIAYNFFGRQGTQLLNMFQQGTASIEALRKEAEKLGLTFSRIDAARVEAANDALTRVRATMTGLFRQATIELSPYIEALANKFVDVATAGEGLGVNVTNVFENLSLSAIRFGGYLSSLPAYWKGFEAAAHQSLAVVYDIANAATNLDILFKKLKLPKWEYTYEELAEQQRQIAAGLLETGGRELAGVYGRENAVRRFYEGLRQEAARRQEAIEGRARQRAAVAGADLGSLNEQIDAMQEHYDKLTAMGGSYQEMQERMARQRIETEIAAAKLRYEAEAAAAEKAKEFVIDAARERVNAVRHMDYATRMERIQNLEAYVAANEAALGKVLEANKILQDELEALEQGKLDALKRWGRDASDIWLNLDRIAVSSLDRMADTLTELCLTGKADFKSLARSIITDITRMMIKMQMAKALGIGGAGGGALLGFGSGLPGGRTGLAGERVGGGGLAGTGYGGGYQYGGIAERAHLAMVGEVPEAIVPLSGGRSIPVEMRGNVGGPQITEHRIINQGSEKLEISKVEEYMISDRRIIEVTTRAMQTDVKYIRNIAQASKR